MPNISAELIASRNSNEKDLAILKNQTVDSSNGKGHSFTWLALTGEKCFHLTIATDIDDFLKLGINEQLNATFCYIDGSTATQPQLNSSVFKSLLYFIWKHLISRAEFASDSIALRFISLRHPIEASLSFTVEIGIPSERSRIADEVEYSGWELNDKGRPGPKMMDLQQHLSPEAIASSALDLNLKLMTWRQFPNLKLDEIRSKTLFIIGIGTLGCSTLRLLLGWGFKKFILMDNGAVSHSNPVRQSLFMLQDVGKPKVEVAAKVLKDISPEVEVETINGTIPMPDHQFSEGDMDMVKLMNAATLKSHVVFLLTDTRESRWLPTVLASIHKKLLINCALGFDSYLVMRHNEHLGCYFCNDVVAPQNSMKDRTLDQQCTVTRPGLANIATGFAVELLLSLLHHPLGQLAPSPRMAQDQNEKVLPHQIRGSVNDYQQVLVEAPAFPQCTACSQVVQLHLSTAINEDNFHALAKMFGDPGYLEQLTGLADLKAAAEEHNNELDNFDDDF